jgi:predicted permease
MDAFLFALNAVLPIIILFIFGYLLKHFKMFNDIFFSQLNKYIFRIALPVLLFYNIYAVNDLSNLNWVVIGFSVAGLFLIFFMALIWVLLFVKDSKQKGVILQASFRSNFALIGLPLAQALGSNQAIEMMSVLFAIAIPLNNIMAVISLSMFQKNEFGKVNPKEIFVSVLKNPLIIAVFIGIIVVAIRSFIPLDSENIHVFTIENQLPFFYKVIQWISQTASPLALIALGGQFEISVIKKLKNQIISGTLWRIVIAPGLLLSIAYFMSLRYSQFDDMFPALIALFASPVAVSSVIMAYEMDNDDQLAGQLVVWTCIGSVFTIFMIIVVLRSLGVL